MTNKMEVETDTTMSKGIEERPGPESSPENVKEGAEKSYEFSNLSDVSSSESVGDIDLILDIPLEVTVELGRTTMLINDLISLGQGSIVELPKYAGQTLDLLANQKLIAKGEVVVVKEKYAMRITEISSPAERVEKLK